MASKIMKTQKPFAIKFFATDGPWEKKQVNAILYSCKGPCCIIRPNLTKYFYLFCSFY